MKVSSMWILGSAAAWFMATALLAPLAAAADYHTGDPFVVTRQGTPLKRGSNVLARLSEGQRLTVLKTQGDWIGASTVVNGETVAGWVYQAHVATPAQYAARRTTRRSYSYQPALPSTPAQGSAYPSRGNSYYRGGGGRSSSSGQFIMGLTPYGRSYWRADRKISGY